MSSDYVAICQECGAVRGWISADCSRKEQAAFARDAVANPKLRLETMETEDTRKAEWTCTGSRDCDKKRAKAEGAAQTDLLAPPPPDGGTT